MGRLIDEDKLVKGRVENDPVVIAAKCTPTAYNPNKVVEQLKKIEKIITSPVTEDCFGEECKTSDCMVCLINKVIEIVKGGGIE
jgi:hypothetical protein